MYLEFAPAGLVEKYAPVVIEEKTTDNNESIVKEGKSIFIKNLNFDTNEEKIEFIFKATKKHLLI